MLTLSSPVPSLSPEPWVSVLFRTEKSQSSGGFLRTFSRFVLTGTGTTPPQRPQDTWEELGYCRAENRGPPNAGFNIYTGAKPSAIFTLTCHHDPRHRRPRSHLNPGPPFPAQYHGGMPPMSPVKGFATSSRSATIPGVLKYPPKLRSLASRRCVSDEFIVRFVMPREPQKLESL